MYTLTPQSLQDISVRVVAKYMNKQASLNEAVASEAINLELNPEQIKRVIEASNSIAYLRQLEDAKDRTFEFPVADYNHVLGHIALPCEGEVATPFDKVSEPVEKQAEAGSGTEFDFGEHQKLVLISKEMTKVAEELKRLEVEEVLVMDGLIKAARAFMAEDFGIEKLAEVCTEDNFGQLAVLVGLEKEAAKGGKIFKSHELSKAKDLVHAYEKAKSTKKEKDHKKGLHKRACEALEKSASLASGIASAAEVIGSGIGYGASRVSSAIAGKAGKVVDSKVSSGLANRGPISPVSKGVLSTLMGAEGFKPEKDAWSILHGNDY